MKIKIKPLTIQQSHIECIEICIWSGLNFWQITSLVEPLNPEVRMWKKGDRIIIKAPNFYRRIEIGEKVWIPSEFQETEEELKKENEKMNSCELLTVTYTVQKLREVKNSKIFHHPSSKISINSRIEKKHPGWKVIKIKVS